MCNYREYGVLKSYINFQLLDHLLEAYERGDDAAQKIIRSFSDSKGFGPEVIVQCVSCKETTIALLAGMIFLVRSHELPPIEKDKHKWWRFLTFDKDVGTEDVRSSAINIIRNSIAHWDECGSGVEFVPGGTEFTSRAGKLELKDKGLHLLVMQMYGYSQHITNKVSRTR